MEKSAHNDSTLDSEDQNISDSFEASALSEDFHKTLDTTADIADKSREKSLEESLDSTTHDISQTELQVEHSPKEDKEIKLSRPTEPPSGAKKPPNAENPSNNLENHSNEEFDRNGSTEHLIVTTDNGSRNGEDEIVAVPEPDPLRINRWEKDGKVPTNWCTTPPVYFLLFTNLIMVLMVFVLPVICGDGSDSRGNSQESTKGEGHADHVVERSICTISPFSILIYCHTIYWFFHLVADQYLKYHHRIGRIMGYLEFYILTKNLRRSPFYITSAGNAILLLSSTILNDSCGTDPNCERSYNIELLRALICIECMTVMFMWTKYIVAVRKFKKDNKKPDVYREDFRRKVLKKTREITAGDPNCSGDTSTLLPSITESRDEIDVGELQSELLILLCPLIGQETDDVRTQIMNGSASAGNGSVNRQTV